MYNWIDGRKFSSSKSLPMFYVTSKHFNPFMRNGFDLSNFNQLPVIKEEDGCSSEDEVRLTPGLLQSPLLKKSCGRESGSYVSDSSEHLKSLQKLRDAKSLTKLPPLVNINCLMNTEIKHKQAIWNTNFGKRLIYGKNLDENVNLSEVKSVSSNASKKGNNKFGDHRSSKTSTKRKCIQDKNIKNGGVKTDYKQTKSINKKPKKMKKHYQNLLAKESSPEISCMEKNCKATLSEDIIDMSTQESCKDIQTVSSFSKKQRLLTECVKSILDCYSTQIECEYCKENLQNIEEFEAHKKQHEAEKETCLLCEKVFYNSNKFIQHLLTHEGVDHFSCKKCKKYFPNLKTYKQHCQIYHGNSSDSITNKSLYNKELFEKWLPKFECKRCKKEFDSEKAQEDHRRDHIRKDLVGAYLMAPKNI